ncbi:MAG: NTP transferase domain-containing protein [Acidobacteria bacterium]|nr:NTP transferase domain-containing protein [Acidobacteriota bacterium]
MLRVRKGVVPAAGRGTRLLPATAAVPKELLPVGLKPLLQLCLEEAAASGLEEVALVLSPGKPAIREFLEAATRPGRPGLDSLRSALERCRPVFVEQPVPRGVADALRRAREFTSGEPFAVLLPDNVAFADPPPLAQMRPYLEPGLCALALTEYRRETAGWFGNCGRVEVAPQGGPRYRVTRLHDKGSGNFRLRNGESELVGYARYVLQPWFFDFVPEAAPGGAEIDDTPILQRIAGEGRLAGIRVEGALFDAGNPAGYAAANRFAG